MVYLHFSVHYHYTNGFILRSGNCEWAEEDLRLEKDVVRLGPLMLDGGTVDLSGIRSRELYAIFVFGEDSGELTAAFSS